MKNLLLLLLIVIAVVMVIISFKASILPPGLTGLGFLIIVGLFYKKE